MYAWPTKWGEQSLPDTSRKPAVENGFWEAADQLLATFLDTSAQWCQVKFLKTPLSTFHWRIFSGSCCFQPILKHGSCSLVSYIFYNIPFCFPRSSGLSSQRGLLPVAQTPPDRSGITSLCTLLSHFNIRNTPPSLLSVTSIYPLFTADSTSPHLSHDCPGIPQKPSQRLLVKQETLTKSLILSAFIV